jgi:hypothetical protein
MEKPVDPWLEISCLIGKEKEQALSEFRSREFDIPAAPASGPTGRPFGMLVRHRSFLAAAAALVLAVGLTLFLSLRGSWQTTSADAGLGDLLADSFLYGGRNRPETGSVATSSAHPSGPFFTTWASGLKRGQAVEPIVPSAPVKSADPDDVRRNIGRAIRKGAFEQLLSHFREFHDKEA